MANSRTEGVSVQVEEPRGLPGCQGVRSRSFKGAVDYFREYCRSSSLHGLQYLGEDLRSITERIFWLVVFVLSIAGCSLVIFKQWTKWHTSPVIVSFSETSTLIWDVPFPAVTICSETKITQAYYNYSASILKHLNQTEYGDNLTEVDRTKLEYASLICNFYKFDAENDTVDEEAVNFLQKVSPKLEDLLFDCQWRGRSVACNHLFSSVITDEGVCYTFNMLEADLLYTEENFQRHPKNSDGYSNLSNGWTLEEGYPRDTNGKEMYPWRALAAGANAGLYFMLDDDNVTTDPFCRYPIEGFKVLLHSPAVFPHISEQYFQLPMKHAVAVGVQPKMLTTSSELRSYSPEMRQCFFMSERKLLYFRIYTQENCELECVTNHTLQQCGCVLYHMPRTENISVCGGKKRDCVYHSLVNFQEDEVDYNRCNCLAACTEIKYDVETSQTKFRWELLKDLQPKLGTAAYGSVSIFFKDIQFINSKRSELYGLTDFIANCGGLLGLFLGFSILSLVEIFYFLALRLWCNFRNTGRFFRIVSPVNRYPSQYKDNKP